MTDPAKQIDEAVENRTVAQASGACGALDEARVSIRTAAKMLHASGLPVEIHRRVTLMMDECHDIEALIGEHLEATTTEATDE